MICGYKKTGKDTLAQYLSEDIHNRWGSFIILANPRLDSVTPVWKYITPGHWRRDSFADEIRREIETCYPAMVSAIRIAHGHDYDRIKEIKYDCPTDQSLHGKSIRDLMLYIGRRTPDVNPDRWVEIVSDRIQESGKHTVISDFRFPNEYEFMKTRFSVTTVRIFRMDVEVPPMDHPAEHDLDNFPTDYVLVPLINWPFQVKRLLEVFPWTEQYVRI